MFTKILNIAFYLTVTLFLLDRLPNFDIKNQTLKTLIYWGILIETPLVLIWNAYIQKTKLKKLIWAIFPIITLISIFIINPMIILFSSGAWQTQTILYKNTHLNFKQIEFQMQDIGALGYKKRTVEVIYLTPFFTISSSIPENIEQKLEWIKVDEEINEVEFKGG